MSKKLMTIWTCTNAIQNCLLGVNDELKLKHNEMRKLNEWNKSLLSHF